MTIQLSLEGSPSELRRVMSNLQANLGDDGQVIGTVNDDRDPRQWLNVTVDVFTAENEEAAMNGVQPAVRYADSDGKVIRGGTLTARHLIPPSKP